MANKLDVETYDPLNDECSASGEGHHFEVEEIPSECITGVEGGESVKCVQCKYCGERK